MHASDAARRAAGDDDSFGHVSRLLSHLFDSVHKVLHLLLHLGPFVAERVLWEIERGR